MPKTYQPPRAAVGKGADTAFFPDTVEPSAGKTVEPSISRRVHSYKIDPAIGKRLRKLAHDRDVPIGQVAEAAFLAYLAEQEER